MESWQDKRHGKTSIDKSNVVTNVTTFEPIYLPFCPFTCKIQCRLQELSVLKSTQIFYLDKFLKKNEKVYLGPP